MQDPWALPVPTLAVLSAGLSPDSRVRRAVSGNAMSVDTLLLTAAVDRLGLLLWMQTEDGAHNRNRPKSLLEQLLRPQAARELELFGSPEAFMAARAKALGG